LRLIHSCITQLKAQGPLGPVMRVKKKKREEREECVYHGSGIHSFSQGVHPKNFWYKTKNFILVY